MTILGLAPAPASTATDLLDFDVRRLGSEETVNPKEACGGRVLLIINTASKCAFTGQYEGLGELYARYRYRGLVVLGFPSNDFGGREPGSEAQIRAFAA
jgi:glutathione peroxidase